uniref:HAT C-terminal dimerisation domain-containing protein n=1 Tax=Meloidogyne javanica TaxID=6303 RepID=A0A915MRX1_MELJA
MPKEESAIWKTGLFQRTEEGSNAVCLDCKEKGRKKSVFALNKGSTSFAKMTEKKISEMNLLRVDPTRQLIVKAVSQFLDPRLKEKNTSIPELFRREVFTFLDQETSPIAYDPIEFDIEPPQKVMKHGLLDDFAESMDVQAQQQTQTTPNLRKEFDEYCLMARESIKSDPLDFWKSNQKKFPLLSEAARKFLSPPATSVPSEQLFSTARDVFTYRRMRIGPKKAEMVIFLNRILPLIDFKF